MIRAVAQPPPGARAQVPLRAEATLDSRWRLGLDSELPVFHSASGPTRPDTAFADLRAVFRLSGGLMRGDDLAGWMEAHALGDAISLARLIASSRVFSFVREHELWVPVFQFESQTLALKQAPLQVLNELAGVFDGWHAALWLASRHRRLASYRPIELLDTDLPAVLMAARADRFIAAG